MGLRLGLIACVLVLLVSAGCGGGSTTPTSLVRGYEEAILSRDGDRLCATFSPKLRQVLTEEITSEQSGSGTGATRFDCGSFYHLLIGYPHENTDRQFIAGKLLAVGEPSRVKRAGVVYVKVPAKLRIDFTYTGYSIHGGVRGEKGVAIVDDTVWLSKGKDGKLGVVKPSLTLLAASSPDILSQSYLVARANAAPPDPDYSMNRAERTASEAADYRQSFRRTIRHAPLRCAGTRLTVADPLRDQVTYPTGSALHPSHAPAANDITRVVVQTAGQRMCVAVTFRKKPTAHLRLGFIPRSRHTFFPEYLVELDPRLGVRGGSLTTGYRYFRGGDQLTRDAVGQIALYDRTVAFVANAAVERKLPEGIPNDLTWSVLSTAPTGSDQVPNRRPTEYVVIRQRDGRKVKSG